MSSINEITFAIKKGLPNFSSVMTSITMKVDPSDKIDEVWEQARKEALSECTIDSSWMSKEEPQNDIKAEIKAMNELNKKGGK